MTDATTMNPLFFNRTVSQVLRLYVIPEIEKRIAAGSINAESLPIEMNQFRVSFRKESEEHYVPVVEINDEVSLIAEVKYKSKKEPGEVVTLADIDQKHCYLRPPEYDGKPAGYFFWRSTFLDYILIFDLNHNVPDQFAERLPQKLHFPIVDFVNANSFVNIVKPLEKFKILSSHNWPPAPGYCPQIMNTIHNKPTLITEDSFVEVVSSIYSTKYWQNKLAFWAETDFFPGRIPYIDKAIQAHYQDDYITSIYVIVPQFEGIIMNYLRDNCGKSPSEFKENIKLLKEECLSRKTILYPKEVLEVILDYIEKGSFWKSSGSVKDKKVEINRHGVVHGIYTGFECKEISLKYLILFDALSYVLLNDRYSKWEYLALSFYTA